MVGDVTTPTGDGRRVVPSVEERIDGLAVLRRPLPGAPRVVFVHGAMDRAGGFVKVVRRLPELEVVRYDRRGYAGSRDGRVHATVDGHVADLLTVLGGEPAVVVGHSLGGVIALAAATDHPDLIPSVASFEAPMPWQSWWPRQGTGAAAHVDPDDPAAAEVAAELFVRRMIGDRVWDRFPPAMQRERRAEGAALVAELRALRDGGALVHPERIEVPVLAGHGSASATRHLQATRFVAEAAPSGELVVIEGAGHGAHYTHAAEFAAFVRRAVARAGAA